MLQNSLYNSLYFCMALLAVALLITAGGCITEQERRGYSDLPQNQPASWESQPYGASKM